MSKIAILSDTHWGARGDSAIFHDYFSRFYREIFFPYLVEHGITDVIHAGDLGDRRKYLNLTTANAMRKEYIEPSQHLKLNTHIIAGNHDTFYKNHNEINLLREFVMGREGFTVYSNPDEREIGGVRFLMLPWISPDNEEKSLARIKGTTAKYCVAHLELVGFEMAKGQMMDHGMDASIFKKFKAVYTGHYHHKSSKGNIHYLGAPYEMTWADCDDAKGFHVLDTETMKLEFIPNPFTIYCKVKLNAKSKMNVLQNGIGKFTKVIVGEGVDRKKLDEALKEADKHSIDVQVVDEHLSIDDHKIEIEIVDDTLKILKDYIMASELDVDKDALIGLMTELYEEAE